ncbi:double zinc ribbon domain-containing protein [Porticoccus sp.]
MDKRERPRLAACPWPVGVRRFSYRLFPGHCLLCGTPSGRPLDLCADCEADLPLNRPSCQRCALPLATAPDGDLTCGACLARPPPFQYCVAPLRYEFPVDSLINSFKYRGQFSRGALLAELLLAALQQTALPELIVPVPLHWRRQFQRGFNQAAWLASYLGRRLAVPVERQLLSRHRHTPHQQGGSRQQRLHNLRGAFRLNRSLSGQTIALVDDVMTTGSTARELSGLLIKGGAARVDIWCLARTPLEK